MSVLGKLASALGRNDEVPNQILAKEIADANNAGAVHELAANLANPDKDIQSDCIKVLYEVGSLKPELIAPHINEFVLLLRSRSNRLVWGAMTALGAIADRTADQLWRHIDLIVDVTDKGSAITQDWGIRVLAAVSAKDKAYEQHILPFLKTFLQKCPAKDLPRHAESVVVAVNKTNRGEIVTLLEARRPSLKPAQAKRLDKTVRKMNAL